MLFPTDVVFFTDDMVGGVVVLSTHNSDSDLDSSFTKFYNKKVSHEILSI